MDSAQKVCDKDEAESLPVHHKKLDYCLTRKEYRRGRRRTAVKVFTVNSESKYLVVTNVHATGLEKDLLKLCSKYGAVETCQELKDYPREAFTQVFLIKFQDLRPARLAKRYLDETSFYGSMLHVFYAPEFETVDETRRKLLDRRVDVVSRVKSLMREERRLKQGQGTSKFVDDNTPSASVKANEGPKHAQGGSFVNLTSSVRQCIVHPSSSIVPHSVPVPMQNAAAVSSAGWKHHAPGVDLPGPCKKKPRLVKRAGAVMSKETICNIQPVMEKPYSTPTAIAVPLVPRAVPPTRVVVPAGFLPRAVDLRRATQQEKLDSMGDFESARNGTVLGGGREKNTVEESWRDDYLYMDKNVKDTALKIKQSLKRSAAEIDHLIIGKIKR